MMMKMTMMFPEGKKGDVQHPPVGYEDAGGSRQRRRKRRKRRPQQRVSRRKSHRVVGFAPKHLLAREHSRRHHPKASSSLVSVSREWMNNEWIKKGRRRLCRFLFTHPKKALFSSRERSRMYDASYGSRRALLEARPGAETFEYIHLLVNSHLGFCL